MHSIIICTVNLTKKNCVYERFAAGIFSCHYQTADKQFQYSVLFIACSSNSAKLCCRNTETRPQQLQLLASRYTSQMSN